MSLLEWFFGDKKPGDSNAEKENDTRLEADHGVGAVLDEIADLRLDSSQTSQPDDECRNYFAEMPQNIINRIAKDLHMKSLGRVQSTCRDLYLKCYNAQRLITFSSGSTFFIVIPAINGKPMKIFYNDGQKQNNMAQFTAEQFKSTDFHFKCRRLLLVEPVTTEMVNSVIDCFKGREVFEFLFIENTLSAETLEPEAFSQLLVDLEIKEFVTGKLPVEWFELAAVKRLVRLHSEGAPRRLSCLFDSTAHSVYFDMPDDDERPDSADMHDLLAQWAAGERDIREYNIANVTLDDDLIGEWPVVEPYEDLPEERPVVVWVGGFIAFRIIRSDGEELRVYTIGKHTEEGKVKHEISFVDKDHPPWCGSRQELEDHYRTHHQHDHEHGHDHAHHHDQEHEHNHEEAAEREGEEPAHGEH